MPCIKEQSARILFLKYCVYGSFKCPLHNWEPLIMNMNNNSQQKDWKEVKFEVKGQGQGH